MLRTLRLVHTLSIGLLFGSAGCEGTETQTHTWPKCAPPLSSELSGNCNDDRECSVGGCNGELCTSTASIATFCEISGGGSPVDTLCRCRDHRCQFVQIDCNPEGVDERQLP